MKNREMVSIIIPTYNRKKSLIKAVESVLSQSYINLEIIIIDNGSNDGTKEAIKILSDSRIKYFFMENLGANPARNLGISKSRGNYIAFLDDDDIWLPLKLEKQMKILETHPEIGMVYTGKKIKYVQENIEYNSIPSKNTGLNIYYGNYIGTTSSVLVKKELLIQVDGFDNNLPALQDYELWLKLSEITQVYGIKEILIEYYNNSNINQISNDTSKYELAYKLINKKYIKTNITDIQDLNHIIQNQKIGLLKRAVRNNQNIEKYLKQITLKKRIYWKIFILLGYKNILKIRSIISKLESLLQK